MDTKIPHCPKCHAKDDVRNGKSDGKKRDRCKACEYHFTVPKLGKGINPYDVRLCLRLYLEELGFRSIEGMVGVSHQLGKELKALRLCERESQAVEEDELPLACPVCGESKEEDQHPDRELLGNRLT
ncbi:MAG: IS1 family transposase [Ekhidna sp.]|nr:IS1 family transposase [Ekhidna sp.]